MDANRDTLLLLYTERQSSLYKSDNSSTFPQRDVSMSHSKTGDRVPSRSRQPSQYMPRTRARSQAQPPSPNFAEASPPSFQTATHDQSFVSPHHSPSMNNPFTQPLDPFINPTHQPVPPAYSPYAKPGDLPRLNVTSHPHAAGATSPRSPEPPRAAFFAPPSPMSSDGHTLVGSPALPNSPYEKDVKWATSPSGLDKTDPDRFAPASSPSTGTDFWKRFSMVARQNEKNYAGSAQQSAEWLKRQERKRRNYKRKVWFGGILLLLIVAAVIAYFVTKPSTANKTPTQHDFYLGSGSTASKPAKRTALPHVKRQQSLH